MSATNRPDTDHPYSAPREPLGSIPKDRMSHTRWAIVVLLFFATVLNYVDRAVLGILKPDLERQLGWSQIDYANIVTSFQLLYAAGYLFSGRLLDLISLRLGYALSVGLWSLAAMAHAAARSVPGFCLARGVGLGRGGQFPRRD